MPNEFSAGAVVLRRLRGRWWVATIRPGGKPEGTWALPKGNVARGDSPADTALREVQEETGLRCRLGIVAEFVPPVEVAPGFDIELDGGERARDVHFAKPQPMRARP
jgi:8-oxo-dGTP pyrophosphatase MutT (NUDIX family)